MIGSADPKIMSNNISRGNQNIMSSSGRTGNMAKKREMAYHYAGKVHVRGLLRRVWRPRYLALGDDGYLRYHESIPPLFLQDPHHKQPHNPYSISTSHSAHDSYGNMYSLHNSHRPKTILAILDGARVIDPHSDVDQHVALPQGVYGFVFRGRPVELYADPKGTERGAPLGTSNSDTEQDAPIVPPENYNSSSQADKHSKKEAVVNLVFPRGTSRRRTAQKIAKKAINPDVLCGFVRTNNCEGGILSRSSSSSSLMGYEQTLAGEEGGNDGSDNLGHSNHEWGKDSYESHDTMGSFQEVHRNHVSGDLHNTPPHNNIQRKGKGHDAQKKSTIQVQVQASSIQSREYLCSVSTAEEAESWVVALTWAAEHRRRIRYENSTHVRNDAIRNASIPGGFFPDTVSSLEVASNEGVDTGEDQEGGDGAIRTGNHAETHQPKSTGKSSSDTSEGKSDGECYVPKESGGDSKASLTSLLIEQDGWWKAEAEKKRRLEDGNNETWADSESPLFPPEEGLPKTEAIPSSQLEPPPSPSFSKKHTIVVTKVCTYQPPQNISFGWESGNCMKPNITWLPVKFPLPGDELVLQYDIQLLLLVNCKPHTEKAVQPELIEKRTICKSIHNVLALTRDLKVEFDKRKQDSLGQENAGSELLSPEQKTGAISTLQADDTFHLLEDVESNLLAHLKSEIQNRASLPTANDTMKASTAGTMAGLHSAMSVALASVAIIDEVMRMLSKDSNICSSRCFQEFLGLCNQSSNRASTDMESGGTDAEQVVRKWLAQRDHPSNMSNIRLLLAITLRHKLCGPIIPLAIIWSISRLASVLWSVVSGMGIIISVPFEMYTTLIALSFFVGHNNGASVGSLHDIYNLEKHRKQSPASIGKSTGDEFSEETPVVDDDHSTVAEEGGPEPEDEAFIEESSALSSPLPVYPANDGNSCWSKPDHKIFMVRGPTYLSDRVKIPSAPAVFECRGVDVWITDNAERNIARHPSVLGGRLGQEHTFIVNFLLPFSNFVAYFTIPPIEQMPANIAHVWSRFIKGDQQYRDGKLKLLPVVVDGPWIVKKAVGPGTSPAMIGRDLPLQYYFTEPTATKKGVYEVDVLVTASRIARGILNVVKGHVRVISIAFAFIIEASEDAQLPETVLCAFQVHSLHLEDCPNLPDSYPDG